MSKKKDTAKCVGYKKLLEWRIANNLPDEWFIAVGGNVAKEIYSLDQIRQINTNSPTSIIQVLNSSQRDDPNAKWVVFREVDIAALKAERSAKDLAIFAYFSAIIIPVMGFTIGLFMIANDRTRRSAGGVIALSTAMMVVLVLVFRFFESPRPLN